MTTMLEQASRGASIQVLDLKRRVYRWLLGPGLLLGVVMIMLGTPALSPVWWLSLLSELVSTLLIAAFLSGRLGLAAFERSLLGNIALTFLGLLGFDLPHTIPMFVVSAQVLYIWSFLTFGTRSGLRAAATFFGISLLVYLLCGPVSHGNARLFALFSLATPIYLACLYAFAAVLEGQAAATLGAVAEQAYRDALTGLPNRLRFGEHLSASLASRTPLALMFIDLDNFKAVNDGLGHQAGDQLLRELAERWQRLLEPGEVLARISGDEFAVICPGLDGSGMLARAAQLLAALDEPFALSGRPHRAAASIGIGLYPDPATSAEELLRHADEAMYAVKSGGKNGAQVYTSELARVELH
jgi:diguanylate cyclase (GGDEF)-like protein